MEDSMLCDECDMPISEREQQFDNAVCQSCLGDEAVIIECPVCGAEQEDFDGFGVVHCEECGYCQHISSTGGVCDICEKEIDSA